VISHPGRERGGAHRRQRILAALGILFLAALAPGATAQPGPIGVVTAVDGSVVAVASALADDADHVGADEVKR